MTGVTGPGAERRPWLVMVTGEPGSGKTTLGLASFIAETRASRPDAADP